MSMPSEAVTRERVRLRDHKVFTRTLDTEVLKGTGWKEGTVEFMFAPEMERLASCRDIWSSI